MTTWSAAKRISNSPSGSIWKWASCSATSSAGSVATVPRRRGDRLLIARRSCSLIFFGTGNPGPDYDGTVREGANLYSCSVLALDPKTGKLKWYFQFTPHDEYDYDAVQVPVLADANWKGSPRKMMLWANRNGFFYVFDRTNGELLLAEKFVDRLTWASAIGKDGRPILLPGTEPSTCLAPSRIFATAAQDKIQT